MGIFVASLTASSHDSYSSSTSLFGRCVERGLMTCGCRIGVISWQEYLIVGSESRISPHEQADCSNTNVLPNIIPLSIISIVKRVSSDS